jgi:hypothetical protein
MAGNLTQWEENQVKAIDNLIQKCKLRYFAFEREHRVLNSLLDQNDELAPAFVEHLYEQVPQRLRHFATDLYSALDFLCYLCYCHFRNDGNSINDSTARNVNFTYKNLKKSDVAGQEVICSTQRSEFVRRQFRTILTCLNTPDVFGPLDEVTQQKYDRFEEIIEQCQIITQIGGNGQPVQPQPDQLPDANSFNSLHYLRNTTVHRNFVHIAVQQGRIYVNLQDGSHRILPGPIPEMENDPVHWQSIPTFPGCWIPVRSAGLGSPETVMRLAIVTNNIRRFVTDTRNNMLGLAFPQAYGEPGGIPVFDENKVRYGLDDGVRIGNNQHYPWPVFDEKCNIDNNSDLWAV